MPLNLQDFIDILAELCEEKHLKASVVGSLRGGLITGLSAVCGGLLLGPVGLAVGGILGGCSTAAAAAGSFESAAIILRRLPYEKKVALRQRTERAFRNFGVQDLAMIGALLLSNSELKEVAFKVVRDFLQNDMKMTIKQN